MSEKEEEEEEEEETNKQTKKQSRQRGLCTKGFIFVVDDGQDSSERTLYIILMFIIFYFNLTLLQCCTTFSLSPLYVIIL